MTLARASGVLAALAAASVLLSSCSGGNAEDPDGLALPLTDEAKLGRAVAADAGCASCHGANGEGGVGPGWVGLSGSQVTLEDGTTVVADRDYLIRSIADPAAEEVAGFAVSMPVANLDDIQIAAIVDYIEELS